MKVGDQVPDFTLPSDEGTEVKLSGLRGRKVVLYFYPKDNTPVCTREACGFRDAFPDFSEINAEIFGISKDSVAKHRKFKAKNSLPFTLLSDENGEVCKAFGTWIEKSMYGLKFMGIERSTFLIDETGTLRAEWRKIRLRGHVEKVVAAAREI